MVYLARERELRNVNGGNSPGLATIAGGHVASDTATLGEGVDVVRVSHIEDNLGVGPS